MNFEDYYKENILPILASFEEERKALVSSTRKRTLTIIFTGLFLSFMALLAIKLNNLKIFSNDYELVATASLLVLISACMGAFVEMTSTKSFPVKLKKEVLGRIVTFIGNDLSYDPMGHISKEEFMASRLFFLPKWGASFRGGDLIEGKINNISIKFCHLHIVNEIDDDHKEIFNGFFFKVSYSKPFRCDLFINGFKSLPSKSNLVKVSLEDPNFNNKFEVYSSDQIMARRILTTVNAEIILNNVAKVDDLLKGDQHQFLDLFVGGRRKSFSFVGKDLFIAIESRDLFNININKPINNFDFYQMSYQVLNLFITIIDDIKHIGGNYSEDY
jgi:hypothetical protein